MLPLGGGMGAGRMNSISGKCACVHIYVSIKLTELFFSFFLGLFSCTKPGHKFPTLLALAAVSATKYKLSIHTERRNQLNIS